MEIQEALDILGIDYNAKPKAAGQAYIRLMTENLEDDAQRAEIREAYERVIDELPYSVNKKIYRSPATVIMTILIVIFVIIWIVMLIEIYWPDSLDELHTLLPLSV